MAAFRRSHRLVGTFAVLMGVALTMPTAYEVEGAGPALDVNGEVDGKPLLSVTGVETYPSDTELYLTTVSAWGGPESGTSGSHAVSALFDPHSAVVPVRAVYVPSETTEQVDQQNQAEMASSQDTAPAVAFALAGLEVHERLTVAQVLEGSPAAGVLEGDDVLQAYADPASGAWVPIDNFVQFAQALGGFEAGEVISLQVERAGELADVQVTLGGYDADETGWVRPGGRLGVALGVDDVQLPGSVDFGLENIGGPSAGNMFALGIYDAVTPDSLAGEAHIAGTGTVQWNGDVGPIGGITHKLDGAAREGASDFLAPALNCAETIGYEPEGMKVWAVRTTAEAIAAAEAIGSGDTSGLTSCRDLVG